MARADRSGPPRRRGRHAEVRHAAPRASERPRAATSRRSRLALLGAVVVSAVVLFAWFPFTSLLSQRSSLSATESQLSELHRQDAALAQEQKNLSDNNEIGRIAREQYQLVTPGQQAYEVLPPAGAAAAGTPYAGDPGAHQPVAPSATAELPPGGVTTTTTTAPAGATAGAHPAGSAGLWSRMVHALEFWR